MKQKLFSMFALLLMAATGAWAQTTVNGLFTVNADGDLVQFASGNLRYTSGAWSFFDHQYDYYAEYSADSWDKFGWSTSGTTYGKSTSTNENLYKGDFVDWGNAVGTGWRTLSIDEWAYVVNTRSGSTIGTTANARFAKAVVCDVRGLIIFPDDYAHPNGVTAPIGINETGATGMNGNSYDATAWALMESAGCVFLPAAGGRYNSSYPTLVVNAGNQGNYWSSTSDNSSANLLTFNGSSFDPSITDNPRSGYSVRLVKSAPTYSITLAEGTEDEGNWNVPAKAAEGATVTATYSGDRKVKSVKAVKKAAVTYTLLSAATTEDVGKVVCAAGHLHDAKTAVPDGCTAVGILGKVTSTGHGLILALKDATAQTWNTINGWTSVTDYAGTTLEVLPDDAARGTNLTSYTTLGETAVSNWAVAQKDDYSTIFKNLGSAKDGSEGTTYDDNVNAYITDAGGAAISGSYWSATLESEGGAYDFESLNWYVEDLTASLKVRPVLGF